MLTVEKSELKRCNRVLLTLKPENWRIFQKFEMLDLCFNLKKIYQIIEHNDKFTFEKHATFIQK